MRSLCLFALVSVSLAACGDSKDEKVEKTFAPICERSTAALKAGDTKDFALTLDNALKSCSAACDGKHEASCTSLSEHVGIICKSTPEICKTMCESKSPSLKKYACPLAKNAAPAPATK